MGLVSRVDQTASIAAHPVGFKAGEFIHTESSYKFDPASLDREAGEAGFRDEHRWTDANDWFCVSLLRRD